MNLKTVTANSMPEALATVKRELGPSAVILHTRTYRRGGVLGFGGRTVVEITAGIGDRVGPRRRQSAPTPTTAVPAAHQPGAGDLIRRTYAAAHAEFQRQNVAATSHGPGTATLTAPVAAPAFATPRQHEPASQAAVLNEQLAQEMRTVRQMVERLMREQREPKPPANLPANLAEQYLNLMRQEVAQELADDIVQQVRGQLTAEQLEDSELVRKATLQAVAQYIPCCDDGVGTLEPAQDGRPRTIALIGPTGVGKTTTIAKLAAIFKLRQRRKVGLITLDTYRIAAVEQLRTYANIIGVPLHVVQNVDELRSALTQTRGCDVVLIDTAGRSQRDDPKLGQLRQFIEAADPHEVHLVLSSTASESVMLEAAERFAAVRTDRIIFTKLDEAVSFGVMLNVARHVNKRLSYLTTGQEVPHQIEAGRAQRLAGLVLGGEI